MKIIDKYIIFNLLKIFTLALFVFLFIGILTRIIHFSGLFSGGSATFTDILLILFLVQPKIVSILAPFTLLIACFITYSGLIHANEHTAIHNGGKGNGALLKPFFLVSGALCVLLLFVSISVVPYSYRKIDKIHQRIALKLTSTILKPKEFVERQNILLFINDVNSSKLAEGIFIADLRNSNDRIFIIANKGTIGFNGANISLNSKETTFFKKLPNIPRPVISSFTDYQILLKVKGFANPEGRKGLYDMSFIPLIENLNLQIKNKDLAGLGRALSEIKLRVGWPIFIILIPFSIIACFLRFFSFTRSKPSVKHIVYTSAIVGYTSISCIMGGGILNASLFQFSLYYLNQILIFIFLLFIAKNRSS